MALEAICLIPDGGCRGVGCVDTLLVFHLCWYIFSYPKLVTSFGQVFIVGRVWGMHVAPV